MHRPINIKFIDAKQAKELYQFKNIKRKLYRTNAAIWYNKRSYLVQQNMYTKTATPKYINI